MRNTAVQERSSSSHVNLSYVFNHSLVSASSERPFIYHNHHVSNKSQVISIPTCARIKSNQKLYSSSSLLLFSYAPTLALLFLKRGTGDRRRTIPFQSAILFRTAIIIIILHHFCSVFFSFPHCGGRTAAAAQRR